MKAQIQLPDKPLIDFLFFCKEIAKAICPARGQELKGIDCITGKLATHNVALPASKSGDERGATTAALQSVLLSDDGRTLDQLRMGQENAATSPTPLLPFSSEVSHNVVELPLTYKLTDDDRELMEKLLTNLPALHYPMSDDEVATFMHAYFDLPNRPAWEPILVTDATIEQRQVMQDKIMLDHQKALQDEHARGRVVAVDSSHVPVVRFAMGAFLPRDQAIAYLNQCGILHSDKPAADQRTVESQAPAVQPEPLEEHSAVGKQKLSDEERRAVVTLYNELKRKGVKGFCKQVAKQFGITDRYVRDLAEGVKSFV